MSVSFPKLGKSQLLFLQISFQPLSLFFWDNYNVNVSMLDAVLEDS